MVSILSKPGTVPGDRTAVVVEFIRPGPRKPYAVFLHLAACAANVHMTLPVVGAK